MTPSLRHDCLPSKLISTFRRKHVRVCLLLGEDSDKSDEPLCFTENFSLDSSLFPC